MSRQVGCRKRQRYDQTLLEEAANLVTSKSISLSQASRDFGIPKTTLHDKVHNRYQSNKSGAKTILTFDEEKRIADWVMHMSRIGYGRTRKELVCVVKKILDDDGRRTPFRDNCPGKDWLKGFFNRHPNLSVRTTLQLGKERAAISASKVQKWFDDYTAYIINEVGDQDLLHDPSRLYNADESGFSLCSSNNQVIGYKGAPVVYNFGNSSKVQLTVMAAASATGHFVPPMIIYPGQRFSYNPLEGFEDAAMGRSETGWMDSEVFCQWLQNVFIPSVESRHVRKPIVLFIDGHSTHVTKDASDICISAGIELYCLLQHASHVMQPLDLRLFASLKRTWKQAVRDWQSEHIGEFVTKRTFARVFRQAWVQSTTVDVAVKGFLESGLYPLRPDVVMQSVKLEPSTLFKQTSAGNQSSAVPPVPSALKVLSSSDGDEQDAGSQDNIGPASLQLPAAAAATATAESQSVTDCVLSPSGPTPATVDPDDTQSPSPGASAATYQTEPTTTATTASSPFSKHLKYPIVPEKSGTVKRNLQLPKAITGSAYRRILQERLEKKESELKEKQRKREEREKKRQEKEEEKKKKDSERKAKRLRRELELEKKRKRAEKAATQSDSDDDSAAVLPGICYTCDRPYGAYIECTKCFRRFHVECADDGLIDDVFECKYC